MSALILPHALRLRALGLSVIPIHSPDMPLPPGQEPDSTGKVPLIAWKEFQTRRATEEEIHAWWAQWPANIGVVTGKVSGVVVLDVDGPEGRESLRKLTPVPITWRHATGRTDGGEQLWFKHPGGVLHNFAKKLPGLDFRGDGGYVVAPPALHQTGAIYRWVLSPWDDGVELAEPPGWLFDLLAAPIPKEQQESEARWWLKKLQGVSKGERHFVTAQIAGHYLAKGREPDEVEAMLLTFAARCSPPHDPQDIRQIVRDLAAKEQAKRAKAKETVGGFGGAEPGQKASAQEGPPDVHFTDLGNARRLGQAHGRDLHYCPPLGGWLIWDGTRWKPDATAEVMRLAKATVERMYNEEARRLADEKDRIATAKWAIQSEADRRLVAMLHLAESEPGIPVIQEQVDREAWVLNLLNGTLDLRTGKLRPHRREDLITKLVPVTHNPAAECQLWDQFLARVLPEPALRRFLQKAVGYALTGDTREQALFILWGTGANGKTTFLRTLIDLLGDYAGQTSSDTLLVRRGDPILNDVARLRGMRLVAAIEAEGGRRLAEALVKQMTGGDRLAARFLYREFFEFVPTFKLFLGVNHKPEIRGTEYAIWRRIRLVPFTVTIPDDEQDKMLREKLVAESSGILRWAIEGCLLWQQEGLIAPPEVTQATAEYREEMDTLGAFLSECCVVDPAGEEKAKILYERYLSWCHQAGEKKPVSRKKFGMLLKERGFRPDKSSDGTRVWKGLSLLRAGVSPDPKEPRWVTGDD